MHQTIRALTFVLLIVLTCQACTSSTDDVTRSPVVASPTQCSHASSIRDQPGRESATRAQLLIALDCRLGTLSPSFAAAFERHHIGVTNPNDQIRAVLRALETIPDRGEDVARALTILQQAAIEAGVPRVVGPAYRPLLRDQIDGVLATYPDEFATAFDRDVLRTLSINQLQSLYATIIDLPSEPEEVFANLTAVHEVAIAAGLVAPGYTRALREAIAALITELGASFADAFALEALEKSSLNQLRALHRVIAAFPDDVQPTSEALGSVYDALHGPDAAADLVAESYKLALIHDVEKTIAATHPGFQRAFRLEGLQRLHIEQLRVVLQVAGAFPDGGRDVRSAFASLHDALVRSGLSSGASPLGYRDLLEYLIDAIVARKHENFRRVFDGSALGRSPILHLEVLEEALRALPPGYDEDGESALIALHSAGLDAGVNLDIGHSRLLAELRAPILAAIEKTLAGMPPDFMNAFSTSGMTVMSPDVLRAVLRELENLPDRGANVGSSVARIHTAAVAAGHDPNNGDFGVKALRRKMQAELRTRVEELGEVVRSYLVTDALDGTDVPLIRLQAVLQATRALRPQGDPVDGLASIRIAAIDAGMSPTAANFGLAPLIADVLVERFSDHVALSRVFRAQHLRDQSDAIALAVYEVVDRVDMRTADLVPVIEAMHDAAVEAGMQPDTTDFGTAYASRLARQLALPRVEVVQTTIGRSRGKPPTFMFEIRNNYLEGVRALRFAIRAYDGFGDAFGGGCIPFPAFGELLLGEHDRGRHTGQTITLSWWWERLACTERADRFELRIVEVAFVDGTRWTP